MDCPIKIGKEISFMLYNYDDIDNMIEKRKQELFETIDCGRDSWYKSKTQIYGHSLEDVIERLEEDAVLDRLYTWKQLLNCFFFYLKDDEYLNNFCKIKYVDKKSNREIKQELNLSYEEIHFLSTKIKNYIFENAVKNGLYKNEVKENAEL